MASTTTRSASEWKELGYGQFKTEERGEGDGKESCEAALLYELSSGTKGRVAGATGKGHGHAEMDALHNFFVEVCASDVSTFATATKHVQCTSKPCCVNCAAVLGLCGIGATSGTYKTPKRMGSTQWGLSMKVKALLGALLDDKGDKFGAFDA